MKNEEIVKALRCVSTAGGANACEHCLYWKEEEVPEEERPIYGADTWHSCDVDRVGLDGADLIERLADRCARYAEEIAVAQERQRWIPVAERRPEQDGKYLCVYSFRTIDDSPVRMRFPSVLDYYATDSVPHFQHEGVNEMHVTHWMPLPEPPKVVE